jgi:hypothetical protein
VRWLWVLLAGCGWSETKFEVEGIGALCDAASSCAGYYDADACYDALRATDRSGCDYDPKAARACADELESASCQPVGTNLPLEQLVVPDACVEVYSCEWIALDVFDER